MNEATDSMNVEDEEGRAEAARLIVLAAVRIDDLMHKKKVSVDQMAKRLNMTVDQVREVLDGLAEMDFEMLARFGLALGIHWDIDQLRR
jgi:transcriptional regulator with XRE-family HTH domain